MLSLTLTPGEYITIGENVVVQYDDTKASRCHLNITAPREISILRGAVREREGGRRPDCVLEKTQWHRKEIPWDRGKAQALSAMRRTLAAMGDREQARALTRQLDRIFPQPAEP